MKPKIKTPSRLETSRTLQRDRAEERARKAWTFAVTVSGVGGQPVRIRGRILQGREARALIDRSREFWPMDPTPARLLMGAQDRTHDALTPSLSHPMGEGARRAGEGHGVFHPIDSSVDEHRLNYKPYNDELLHPGNGFIPGKCGFQDRSLFKPSLAKTKTSFRESVVKRLLRESLPMVPQTSLISSCPYQCFTFLLLGAVFVAGLIGFTEA